MSSLRVITFLFVMWAAVVCGSADRMIIVQHTEQYNVAFYAGNYKTALAHINVLALLAPKNVDYLKEKAKMHLVLEQVEQCVMVLRELTKISNENANKAIWEVLYWQVVSDNIRQALVQSASDNELIMRLVKVKPVVVEGQNYHIAGGYEASMIRAFGVSRLPSLITKSQDIVERHASSMTVESILSSHVIEKQPVANICVATQSTVVENLPVEAVKPVPDASAKVDGYVVPEPKTKKVPFVRSAVNKPTPQIKPTPLKSSSDKSSIPAYVTFKPDCVEPLVITKDAPSPHENGYKSTLSALVFILCLVLAFLSKPAKRICTNCGMISVPVIRTRGSVIVEIILWLCGFLPGLIYRLWRKSGMHENCCPQCGASNMAPLGAPVTRKIQQW